MDTDKHAMPVLAEARLTVVGLGLMGGSLAMACKQGGLCREVIGVTRRLETVRLALALGAVHYATTQLVEGLSGADIVVLAAPVRTIIHQLGQLATMPLRTCLLLDLGSTKRNIVTAMQTLPPQVQPVGAHPMCGKETSGLAAAEPALFQGAPWVLVPLPRTSPQALELARELALAVGARPLVLDAERHDRLVAAISHLPYALAVALVLATAELGAQDDTAWTLAASGFRDTSRLAASDVDMMLDILVTNRIAVGEALARASAQLGRLADLIARGDEEALRALLSHAKAQRAPRFPA
jgi:prephenate dehydrogenase